MHRNLAIRVQKVCKNNNISFTRFTKNLENNFDFPEKIPWYQFFYPTHDNAIVFTDFTNFHVTVARPNNCVEKYNNSRSRSKIFVKSTF